MRIRRAVVIATFAAFAGCSQPELTRRYDTRGLAVERKVNRYLEISAFVKQAPPTTQPSKPVVHPSVSQLSDRGQASFFQQLAAKAKDLQEFVAAAQGPSQPEAPPAVVDRTKLSRRIIFSTSKKLPDPQERVSPGFFGIGRREGEPTLAPGDRVDAIGVELSICDPALGRFLSVSRLETEYQTVDLGKLTLAQETSASAQATIGPTTNPTPVGLTGTLSGKRTLTEEIALRQRIEAITPLVSPDGQRLSVFREGVVGIDLSGSFALDVDLELKVIPVGRVLKVQSYADKGKNPVSPDKLSYRLPDMLVPPPAVTATLSGRYRVRRAMDGHNTVVEGDDRAEFVAGDLCLADPVHLVPPNELAKLRRGWFLFVEDQPETHRVKIVRAGVQDDQAELLMFDTQGEAEEFLRWLRAIFLARGGPTTVQLGTLHHLMTDDGALTTEQIRTVDTAAMPN